MKILIIEDETPNFLRLQKLLNDIIPEAEIVGPADSVAAAKDILSCRTFDIILADIRLSDGLVFEAFDEAVIKSPVIFTTAYDEYAIKAFKYNGVDYLLKPIAKTELEASLKKVQDKSGVFKGEDLNKLYRLLQNGGVRYRERFLVQEKDGYNIIMADDVRYIYFEGGITRLFLKDGHRFIIDQPLNELEEQLDPKRFFRATRQHIVNIDGVERISNWFNRKVKIHLADYQDVEIIVSKEKTSFLKQWLGY